MGDLPFRGAIVPRDPVIPDDAIATLPAAPESDLPVSWRELLRDALTVLDLPSAPDLFPDRSLQDLCAMASTC